jgi:pimeloyl-ACP methyl ester carboxylesterase
MACAGGFDDRCFALLAPTPPGVMIRAHVGGIAKEDLRFFPLRKGFDLRVFLLEPLLDQGLVALLRAMQRLLASDAELCQQSTNRIGAQRDGALWNYRVRRRAFRPGIAEQQTFAGRTIDVPAQVIAAREDWGANRTIGGPMNIGKTGFTQFKGVHMVERAGHWAHEEQPEKVSELLTAFLRG